MLQPVVPEISRAPCPKRNQIVTSGPGNRNPLVLFKKAGPVCSSKNLNLTAHEFLVPLLSYRPIPFYGVIHMCVDYDASVSFHLKLLRYLKGVSIFEVCRETRIPFKRLSRAEHGFCRYLKMTDICVLAQYYNVPVSYLFKDAKKESAYLLGILLEKRLKRIVAANN